MTRARNIAGFSTITTTPSPVHVGPIGVLTATRIDGEFNQVDLATRNITAAGIAATNLQVSGITTGLNVSGIITAQNGINFNGTSTGLNVSGIATFSGGVSIGGTLTYEDVTNVDSVGIITARSGLVVSSGVGTFTNTGAKSFNATRTDSGSVAQLHRAGNTSGGGAEIRVSDGFSSTVPVYSFWYNNTSGIGNPAANETSFIQGGSEKLRIDSGGKLLVGDAGATGAALVQVQKTSGDMVLVRNHATNYESLILSVASGTADIYASSGGSTSRPALRFITSDAERLRIASDGKVGINAINPNALLEVRGTAGTYTNAVTVFSGNTSHSGSNAKIGVGLFTYGDALSGGMSSNLLYSNSATPTQTYSTRSSGKIEITNTTAAKTSQITFGGYVPGSTTFVERLRIDNDGRMALGYSSAVAASTMLTLYESAGNAQTLEIIAANSTGAGSQPGIKFTNSSGGNTGGIFADTNSGEVRFQTNGTERLKIDQNGTVTTTITSPDPYNTIQTNLQLTNGAGNSGAGSRINFVCGSSQAHIQSQVTGGNSTNGTALVFATSDSAAAGTARVRIETDGRLSFATEANAAGSPSAVIDIGSHSNKAAIRFKGCDNKSGMMFHKRIHNGATASAKTVTLLTVDSFQSTNSHIYVRVTVMGVSPTAAFGFKVEGFAYGERGSSNTDVANTQVGAMELQGGSGQNVGTGSNAQGTLSWSGQNLQYNTPAVAYVDMHVNVEYHAYDGATVTLNVDKATH